MKLMKKIALIFLTMTLISSLISISLGNSMIDGASHGELDRGPGRLTGVINKLDGEVNKVISQAREYGEYFSISYKLDAKYSEDESKAILDIKNKVMRAPILNMVVLDNNFTLKDKVKITNIDVNSEDIIEIFAKSKDIINSEENSKRGFGGGLVTTDNLMYIVGVKSISVGRNNNIGYNVTITPLDLEYMTNLEKETNRRVKIVKKDNVVDNFKELDHQGRKFWWNKTQKTIDFYTEVKTAVDGPTYLYCLIDEQVVRNNSKRTVAILVIITISVITVANTITYRLIKEKVLKRIIEINKVVNSVTTGKDLNVNLHEDNGKDEISVLNSDLKKMLGRFKVYSDNLEYMGTHDILTGLIDRNKVLEHITKLSEEKKDFSVFFIDLDNFKGINDTMGHNSGDKLLCSVSDKLIGACDENTIVSRFGGDEFIVVREGKNNKDEVLAAADKLLNAISFNYEIGNSIYEIRGSIGISFYPEHSLDKGSLLQYSDIAMYNSKRNGGNIYSIFNTEMLEVVKIESKLKGAIENEELQVYYQPIYGIDQKDIIGAEALIRWKTDEGMIFPDKFIPIAKRTGDIVDIDMYVLRESIKTCREWIDKGREDFYISINASHKFLKQKNLVSMLKHELESKNIPSNSIRLEITEDEIIDDFEFIINLLDEIRSIGIKVYLDEFGAGYSTINHIKVLPVDVVKIDRSLLIDICDNEKSKSIIETMIALCHKLGMKIVCEGVEDEDQVDVLTRLECDSIQGYYFSRPLEKDKFNEFLSNYK